MAVAFTADVYIPTTVAFADLNFGMETPARRGRRALVLYDGVCGLCDRFVQFLLVEDRECLLQFAPLQGETARAFVAASQALDPALGTIVFVLEATTGERTILTRSTAVLRILDTLGGVWRVVSWLRVLPRPLRDAVYTWVARHRYTWFGHYDACPMPSPDVRARFLA